MKISFYLFLLITIIFCFYVKNDIYKEADYMFLCKNQLKNLEINLIIQIYDIDLDNIENFSKIKDILICLYYNILNNFISEIHILTSMPENKIMKLLKDATLSSNKLVFEYIKDGLTYKKAIEYANEKLNHKIVIIANSDNFFDNSLIYLLEFNYKKNLVYYISRQKTFTSSSENDVNNKDQCSLYTGSHEALVFMSPIAMENEIDKQDALYHLNIPLGTRGVESRIIQFFKKRYILQNPCKSINVFHIHRTKRKNVIDYRKYFDFYAKKEMENAGVIFFNELYPMNDIINLENKCILSFNDDIVLTNT